VDTTITSLLIILGGVALRLAIPILGTLVLIFFLRKLDNRWQAEAALQVTAINKPECWKIKGCPPEEVIQCEGANSPLPCWQVYRQPNGYLNEECLSCTVFTEAPVPTLKIEPRRL
jgi:hypothetical protein